jgi:hypothetical protein
MISILFLICFLCPLVLSEGKSLAATQALSAVDLLATNKDVTKKMGELGGCWKTPSFKKRIHKDHTKPKTCTAEQEKFGIFCLDKCARPFKQRGLICSSEKKGARSSWKFRMHLKHRHEAPNPDEPTSCPVNSKEKGPLCIPNCPADLPFSCGAICLAEKGQCTSMLLGYSVTTATTAIVTGTTGSALPVLIQLPNIIQNLMGWGKCKSPTDVVTEDKEAEEEEGETVEPAKKGVKAAAKKGEEEVKASNPVTKKKKARSASKSKEEEEEKDDEEDDDE